jgi:hypothetical protein
LGLGGGGDVRACCVLRAACVRARALHAPFDLPPIA